ncbi:glycoside hydrolase family 43 protein [Paenibacillus sp. UMB7766-LJ446]|uniref:glycoside hydrolase family 43 protein n=1 Tax=Paenibacillus sp. UMB7766-LJ446 TaxID=3046313 RepID=UPI00254C3EF3|nr:glycoside hydrolase family 43 protein [Paenibacillus sp. UMB7766-LJ446]MDK8192700.1 glycoside hydrolase family 43 protein [Paenibacillus sp. UMB7766-LJ446]
MSTFRNPVIPGCYADPSVCRVEEDYYLVTSSFEYFPGVPIFHSRDLVHWRQLGHVLDRPSQLNLKGTPCSKGIYAATIRHHNGIFYVITTFVESVTGARNNFYVTSTDPSGPWSDPVWLQDAPGIDPSIFFDDDGRCYMMANRLPPDGQQYPKHMEIWMQELDVTKGCLIGSKFSLWDGAMKFIHAQEGPHMYKLNGYYYLIIAEGGTGHTHSVTIARSTGITGPYENCKRNPILTHRHLGLNHPVTNIGHADIVQTQNGEWWMFCLGSRPYGGYYRNLGRETFLVPLVWEEGWPVVNPGKGIVELELPRPCLPEHRWPSHPICDHFDAECLAPEWNFIRTPLGNFMSLSERPGHLRLRLKPEKMTDCGNPSFVGRRQQHICFAVRTVLEFVPHSAKETAGLILLQNNDFQYRVECTINDTNKTVRLIQCVEGTDQLLAQHDVAPAQSIGRLYLKVEAIGQDFSFYFGTQPEEWKSLIEHADGTILSVDVAGGFSGTYIGLFASSNGETSANYADFDYFEYAPLDYKE